MHFNSILRHYYLKILVKEYFEMIHTIHETTDYGECQFKPTSTLCQKKKYLLNRQAPPKWHLFLGSTVRFKASVRYHSCQVPKVLAIGPTFPYQTRQIYRTESKVSRFVTPQRHNFPKKVYRTYLSSHKSANTTYQRLS